MSKYKGGYILADISETVLDDVGKDLLPVDLKEYLKQFLRDDGEGNKLFTKEVLMKPIILILQSADGYISRVEFTTIADDSLSLLGRILTGNYEYEYFIGTNLKIIENINVFKLEE